MGRGSEPTCVLSQQVHRVGFVLECRSYMLQVGQLALVLLLNVDVLQLP